MQIANTYRFGKMRFNFITVKRVNNYLDVEYTLDFSEIGNYNGLMFKLDHDAAVELSKKLQDMVKQNESQGV